MALKLASEQNPILKVYAFFQQAGLQRVDTAEFFGFRNLKLRTISSARAQALIQELRGIKGALSRCRLTLTKLRVLDFVPPSPTEWLDRATIEQFSDQMLCVDCRDILTSLVDDLEALRASASWPSEDPEKDTLGVLDQLSNCQSCGDGFELDLRLAKDVLVKECLLDASADLAESVSALLWYDDESLKNAFDYFDRFLLFIVDKAEKPIVVFLYASPDSYPGDFFKIFSLTESTTTASEREGQLAQYLTALTAQTLADYKLLRMKHGNESRPQQRLDLPPSLFLQRKGELAEYPSHPLFDGGPIRSVLIYAMMSWLADESWLDNQTGHFNLPRDSTQASKLLLNFSRADVQQEGTSIFDSTSDWRAVTALVVREIGLSAGSEDLRSHWRAVLRQRGSEDFAAGALFRSLKAVYEKFREQKEKPVQLGRTTSDLLEIFVRLDPERKELRFEINGLGYLHQPVGEVPFSTSQSTVQAAELSELARSQLSRILVPDKTNPKILVPSVQTLAIAGVGLWLTFIPDDLKRAYSHLRNRELTIFIVSSDPSFPWELVKPLELKEELNPGFTDLWWAVKFSLARWLSGRKPPANEVSLNRICCVADKRLAASGRERAHLESIGSICDLPQAREELIEFLSTRDYDLIHFACHGTFDRADPGESVALLPDGYSLTPKDFLVPEIMNKFNENHPLIFLNSCHSGRTGQTLIGIEGWAKGFIDLRCGAFIGCGWEVNDQLAADFAVAFYEAFKRGESLGKAVHEARGKVKKTDEDNSTWLAYYLYGNPNCRLRK